MTLTLMDLTKVHIILCFTCDFYSWSFANEEDTPELFKYCSVC